MEKDSFFSGSGRPAGKRLDLESALFWRGLRSYVFHISAESQDSPSIKKVKALLSHPDICFSVDELSRDEASHVMDEDFRGMQMDVHSLRIGKKRIPKRLNHYAEEVAELHHSIKRGKAKIFQVKVLIDADKLDRASVKRILHKVRELMHSR